MRVLAISGSLRADSHNTRLLRHLARHAPEGVEIELWESLRAIPPYDADDDVEPAPAAVAELRDRVAAADGLLFATPEYNSSIPGVLKMAERNVVKLVPLRITFIQHWVVSSSRWCARAAGGRAADEALRPLSIRTAGVLGVGGQRLAEHDPANASAGRQASARGR